MEENDLIQGKELAIAAANIAVDNKAKETQILDLQGISSIADYFVICTGESIPHLRSISREIRNCINDDYKIRVRAVEGTADPKHTAPDSTVQMQVDHEEAVRCAKRVYEEE
ncbi:MAG: RsfS/YbeB/iojap family protein, partial [Verrucomicrobiota bacterium]|nr:RsfS/YbeB/iojap family protein [Verrucomicrobiota bacterium]